ncbi:zinc-ribbon domain-containing protein [uncultured Candidatus Pelagibacter sp.]|uniref:zinc-ribbon domain-containing protein n=1 Tax=uncultured Candidatus Pelagibacter sp. TaxID=372654 RepID=UPI00261C0E4D|nr:zinc-ribbon domain-containing protein [uncultured Candidatus Pelagibacter sp.]
MIIACPNCNKKFKIDPTLIPEDGRDLKCGSCNHVWLYKVEVVSSIPLALNDNVDNNEIEPDDTEKKKDIEFKKNQLISKKIIKKKKEEKTKNTGSKFFSYLIVFIISLIALMILLDTLKSPLIDIFPDLEFVLFSLFETLKDIKLFIIDLY